MTPLERAEAEAINLLREAILAKVSRMPPNRWFSDLPGCVADAASEVRKEVEDRHVAA